VKKKKQQIPLTAVIAVGLGVTFVAVLFFVIKPMYDKTGALDTEIASIDSQIVVVEKQLAVPPEQQTGVKIEAADLFRLAKAMPDADDVSGIVLELDSVAQGAGVELLTITPQAQLSGTDYRALPMQIVVDGGYFEMADFLFRLRTLVTVRHAELDASGRMYTVDAMDLHEGEAGFPELQGSLMLSAYSYGTGVTGVIPAPVGAAPAPAATPAPSGSTDTSGASTGEAPAETAPEDTENPPAADQAALGGGS
jgi:Tfp pilus assembly protein PilO